MSKFKDLTGQQFGKLIVLEKDILNNSKHIYWHCKCQCGSIKSIRGSHLKSGSIRTCRKCNIYKKHPDGHMICTISNESQFIFNEQDYNIIKQYNWYLRPDGYIATNINNTIIRLHRLIMNVNNKMFIDHKNHNILDNRRENLRICTKSENDFNRQKIKGTSKYKGVHWDKVKNKWTAKIQLNKKQMFLGYYISEEKAALEYNKNAKELFGEFAWLNNIERNV